MLTIVGQAQVICRIVVHAYLTSEEQHPQLPMPGEIAAVSYRHYPTSSLLQAEVHVSPRLI